MLLKRPSSPTEEEILRSEEELLELDEEIRRLEYQQALEQQRRTVQFSLPATPYYNNTLPTPEYLGGGAYPYIGGGYPSYPPMMMYPPPPQNVTVNYLAAPAYPQGYYIPPYAGPPPPSYALYAAGPTILQSPPATPPPTRFRSDTQSLNEVQAMAQRKSENIEKPSLSSLVSTTLILALSMLGSSLFVMLRDWIDPTKARAKTISMEQEETLAFAAVEQIEQQQLQREHTNSTTSTKRSGSLTKKEKVKRMQSVKKLIRAKSITEVVGGLRDSGREEEAESLARRVLAIRRQMYGDEHPATAHALNQLGGVLARIENYSEASKAFESALAVLRNTTTIPTKKQIIFPLLQAHLLHNLAIAKLLQSKEEASTISSNDYPTTVQLIKDQYGKECYELCEKHLGMKHPKTIHYKKLWCPGFAASLPKDEKSKVEEEEGENIKKTPVELVLQAAVELKSE